MKTLFTRITVLFFAFFISTSSAHAQQFQWVTGGGTIEGITISSQAEQVKYMCTDPSGNVYVLSMVGDDPVTADTFSEISYGDNDNLLVTSYTCNGQMRWAKLIQSSGYGLSPFGIQADSLGNIYVAGVFQANGTILYIGYDTTIGPPSSDYLSTGLIRFDTSGNFKWIRYIGANTFTSEVAVAGGPDPIAIDGSNNVHYLCWITATGIPLMTGVTSTYGVYDMTYNTAGTLVSAVRLDLDSQWYLMGAVIDPETNKLYTYGQINTSGGAADTFFAAAFDASRNLLWQYFTGGGDGISGITLDQSKHLYFCGNAATGIGENRFIFNSDSILAPYAGLSIIMKTDTNGTVEWIDHYGCSLTVNGFGAITLLPDNKIAAIGSFAGTVYYDGTAMSTIGGQDPYFVVVDSSGYLQTIQQIYGDGFYNWGLATTSDKVGNLYIGGLVSDSIYAGIPPIPAYHSIGGNTDFFVMKYGVNCSCTTMPVASYTSTGTTTVTFTYTGTTTGLDSMRWNFGDGDTSSLTNPVHTYTAAGTFQACVTVYTDCGYDSICNDYIIPCITAPTASYTATGTPTVTFTYTGTTTGVDSVLWNFGDGGTDTGLSALHTYTATGTYSVCATAYSTCGNVTSCNTVSIPCLTSVVASYTYTVTAPAVSFNYTGTTTGIDSMRWNFGDGSTSALTDPTHTYSAIGTYSVCVTVYTACGSNTFCQDIAIPCIAAPAASYTYTSTSPTVNFTYTGSTAGIDSVVWSFGDGGTSTATSPSYSYTAIGTYSVCVTAYSACGSNTYCSEVVIPCIAPPTASFTDTGTQTIGFTYTGTTSGVDSVVWSFGDGGTSAATSPIYTYTATGTYNVCVTAYSACGSNIFCSEVTIICVASPIASFTYTGIDTLNFTYTGTLAEIDSVVWNYGDGSTDTGITTIHAYVDTGTYTVCVTVYTNCGSDSSCSVVIVSSTGITALSVSTIQVFPNPATDALNITGVQQNTSYRLLNVTGECVQQGDLKPGSNTAPMQSVSPGVYILEMTGAGGERNMVKVVRE